MMSLLVRFLKIHDNEKKNFNRGVYIKGPHCPKGTKTL